MAALDRRARRGRSCQSDEGDEPDGDGEGEGESEEDGTAATRGWLAYLSVAVPVIDGWIVQRKVYVPAFSAGTW
jgi:hypothetical protein